MLAKRLVAVAVAIALVAGALWLRSRRDSGGSADPGTTTLPTDGPATVCITELADACREAAASADAGTVVVEPAGTTIDRLATATSPGPVTWVTLAPLPELVDTLRAANGLEPIFPDQSPVASSNLTVAARTDQLGTLAAACGGTVGWRCIGDVAGKPWGELGGQPAWGDVQPAHDDPESSARGLLTFANAVVGYFGRADLATIDLEDEQFLTWVRRLERAVPSFGGPQGTPFEQFLLLPAINVVGTTEAEVEESAGARRGDLSLAYPAPMTQVDAVIATSDTAPDTDDLASALSGAATERGWSPPSAAPAGTPPGLPPTGMLQALRQLWSDVTR